MPRGPIFVGGLAHSGKTLLRLMLSSHPNIVLTRRTDLWTGVYDRYGNLARPENFDRCLAAILRTKHLRPLGPDPYRLRREFWQGEPTYARLFALLHEHFAQSVGKPRWGDQTALIERFADPIFTAYPNARMIHMIRDPRDCYKLALNSTNHRIGKVGSSTAAWLHSVALAKRNQLRYPDRYLLVRYETLMAYPRETLSGICSFLEEAFVPDMLSMKNAIRFSDESEARSKVMPPAGINLASQNELAAQALSRREIAFMQARAGRAMITYNYQLSRVQCSPRDRFLLYFLDMPAGWARTLAWRCSLLFRAGYPARVRASCG